MRRWLRDEAFAGGSMNHEHEHADVNRHDDRIRAFCITRDRPISWAALSAWLDGLAQIRGDDLLRLKAIVAVSGPARSAGRTARRAAPLPPARPAPGVAERGPAHAHGLHHPRPAARGNRGDLGRLRRGRRGGLRFPRRKGRLRSRQGLFGRGGGAGGALAVVGVEQALAQADRFRRHLDQLVVGDIGDRLLQAHDLRRGQPHRLVL